MRTFYVYIMANKSRTLYTGVTNNLERRVGEHQRKLVPGFTEHYNINRLVYYEVFGDVRAAIGREKQIKGWLWQASRDAAACLDICAPAAPGQPLADWAWSGPVPTSPESSH